MNAAACCLLPAVANANVTCCSNKPLDAFLPNSPGAWRPNQAGGHLRTVAAALNAFAIAVDLVLAWTRGCDVADADSCSAVQWYSAVFALCCVTHGVASYLASARANSILPQERLEVC